MAGGDTSSYRSPSGRAGEQDELERIRAVLEDNNRLKELVRSLFVAYAGSDRRLQQHAAIGLCVSLGAQLRLSHEALKAFDEVREMFYRYDFGGTGELDIPECGQLVKGLLRRVRDRLDPPAGVRRCALPWKNLSAEFRILKQLGQGGQGAVYLAETRHRVAGSAAGLQRVVKFYAKADATAPLDDIKEEFTILRKLDHPMIARVHDIFEDSAHVFMVSEPYFGGDLTTLLAKAKENGVTPDSTWLGRVLKQVLEGVAYLHSQMVMHCDLKEPNVMVANDSKWQKPRIVIIDFGMAKDFNGSREGGTPGYMPPEAWTMRLWTPRGDVFSLAVTCWSVFHGIQGGPFLVADAPPYAKIRMATLQAPIDCRRLPHGLKDLVEHMASKDFRRRPSARVCLESAFFQNLNNNYTPVSSTGTGFVGKDPGKLADLLDKACERQSIQNIIAAALLDGENLGQLRHLNELFARMDKDSDGTVSEVEARTAMTELGITRDQVDRIVAALIGEGGTVRYSGFMAKLLLAQRGVKEEQLASIFASIDRDGSGSLDLNEVRQLLEQPEVARLMEGRTAEDVLREMDTNCDGEVSFAEFKKAMMGQDSSDARTSLGAWAVGDACSYYSRSRSRWLPCEIEAIDPATSAVMVNIKVGQWLLPQEQQVLLARERRAWSVGDLCRYYDQTSNQYLDCKVTNVNVRTGELMVDARKDAWVPAASLCEPARGGTAPPATAYCKVGHRMQCSNTSMAGWTCNVCKRDLPVGAIVWGCRNCNYDCCMSCSAVTIGTSSSASYPSSSPRSKSNLPVDRTLAGHVAGAGEVAALAEVNSDGKDALVKASPRCTRAADTARSPSKTRVVEYADVLVEHMPRDPKIELRLRRGETIIIMEEHESGWAGGYKEGNEVMGWFPSACVRKRKDGKGSAEIVRKTESAKSLDNSKDINNIATSKRPPALDTGGFSPNTGRQAVALPLTSLASAPSAPAASVGPAASQQPMLATVMAASESAACATAQAGKMRLRAERAEKEVLELKKQLAESEVARVKAENEAKYLRWHYAITANGSKPSGVVVAGASAASAAQAALPTQRLDGGGDVIPLSSPKSPKSLVSSATTVAVPSAQYFSSSGSNPPSLECL